MVEMLAAVHPGEVLLEEFLQPLGITQYRLAKDTTVPARRINEIVHGQRSISADTALRLARFFGTSELFWLNLQAGYDLDVERQRLGERLQTEVRALVADPTTAKMKRSVAQTPRTSQGRSRRPGAARKAR